jgi:hypothetical protein
MEISMISRSFAAAFVLAVAMAGTSGVQAEYASDGRYLDPKDPDIVAACRGLEAQSRMSLTSNVPDDVDNGDPSSEYALRNLPFTVGDCRRAGIS